MMRTHESCLSMARLPAVVARMPDVVNAKEASPEEGIDVKSTSRRSKHQRQLVVRRSIGPQQASPITPLRSYRWRLLGRRAVREAKRFGAWTWRVWRTIPTAFWIGVLTGLLAGAGFLMATGHQTLFIQPGLVRVAPKGPVPHGRTVHTQKGQNIPGSTVPG